MTDRLLAGSPAGGTASIELPRNGAEAGPATTRTSRWAAIKPALLRLVASYIALTAVWSTVGWMVTSGPLEGLRSFDERVSRAMVLRRTPRWDSAAYWVAHAADTYVKIGATAVLAALCVVAWRRWHEPALIALSLILEASVFITVTMIVQRPRPDVPRLEASPIDSSFPSGHTAAAAVYAALAVIVFWHTRRRLWRFIAVVASLVAPVLVGLSRVYAGMHHLTDVAAGALLGFATLYAVAAIISRPSAGRAGHR